MNDAEYKAIHDTIEAIRALEARIAKIEQSQLAIECPDCSSKACWDVATQTCHAPECCEETCCNPEPEPEVLRCGCDKRIGPFDEGMCDECYDLEFGELGLDDESLTPAQEELGDLMRGNKPTKSCCKCGSEDLLVRWQQASTYRNTSNQEVLQVICRNCQYSWDEPPLDAKGPNASTDSQAKPY